MAVFCINKFDGQTLNAMKPPLKLNETKLPPPNAQATFDTNLNRTRSEVHGR
jgi:hypothetical protein